MVTPSIKQIAWFKYYVDVTDTRPRDQKNEWYRTLLEAEYERDPSNGRTVFYLANTYRDMGLVDEAIDKYEEKLSMSGQWVEEVVLSRYQLLVLYLKQKNDPSKAIEQAEGIRRSGRMRPEPFYELCRYYREAGDLAESAKYLFFAQVHYVIAGGLNAMDNRSFSLNPSSHTIMHRHYIRRSLGMPKPPGRDQSCPRKPPPVLHTLDRDDLAAVRGVHSLVLSTPG